MSPLEAVLAQVLGCGEGDVWAELFALLAKVYDNTRLGSLGADAAMCEAMAQSVIENQQRLLGNNPVALTEGEVAEIYQNCL